MLTEHPQRLVLGGLLRLAAERHGTRTFLEFDDATRTFDEVDPVANMPRFWVPRYIEFKRAMPKTPSQKIQKYQLRQDSGLGEVFDREEFSEVA